MSRGLWFAAGAGVTLYAVNKARRVRETFTVDGFKDRVQGLAAGAKMFRDEVAQGRVDAEAEMRERLGLATQGPPELTASPVTRSPGTGPTRPGQISSTNQEGTN